MSELLRCENVKKSYEQGETMVDALRGVTLSIAKGEFLSLSGPSGSGKSTLLNLCGGLDTPTSGCVLFEGQSLGDLSRAERTRLRLERVGFVFQSYNLIPVLTAVENVEFVMELQGVPKHERRARAVEILAEVGLAGMEKRRPGQLSGGQQQRVAVARAMISQPSVILADEPTANLDSETARQLLKVMRQMNERSAVTFLFSTHDPLVMDFARRVVKLHDGEIQSDEERSS